MIFPRFFKSAQTLFWLENWEFVFVHLSYFLVSCLFTFSIVCNLLFVYFLSVALYSFFICLNFPLLQYFKPLCINTECSTQICIRKQDSFVPQCILVHRVLLPAGSDYTHYSEVLKALNCTFSLWSSSAAEAQNKNLANFAINKDFNVALNLFLHLEQLFAGKMTRGKNDLHMISGQTLQDFNCFEFRRKKLKFL